MCQVGRHRYRQSIDTDLPNEDQHSELRGIKEKYKIRIFLKHMYTVMGLQFRQHSFIFCFVRYFAKDIQFQTNITQKSYPVAT